MTAPSISLQGFTAPFDQRAAYVAPRASAAVANRQRWERHFRTLLRISDTIVVTAACMLASVLSLLATAPGVLISDPWLLVRIPLSSAIIWMVALSLLSTRDASVTGVGVAEYKRVGYATWLAFGSLAAFFALFGWEGIRAQLYIAMPFGLAVLLWSRKMWRHWLFRQRAMGHYSSRAVVVGYPDDVEYAMRILGAHEGSLGYQVVGTTLLDDTPSERGGGEHVSSVAYAPAAASAAAAVLNADTIVVASQPAGDPSFVKRLAWESEGTAAEVVLSSRIADVAGPRMSLRPVEGLPLIHVRIPQFEGGAYLLKRALDICVATVALLLFAPFAFVIGVLIKIDDPGPVFFRQSRVGRDGQEFKMVKFRSMRVDAEAQLAALREANEGAGPLFKLKNDPRITRVGRVLRRFSLDEVPQFWNVLRGDMSVVGPRPPLPDEVTSYDGVVFRRLYIKPGITGPWQVGGRSDLSWDESVRLDLRYVENWSVLGDLQLMWRTVRVMVKPEGAY
ncbi:MAG: sugar transferase [Microbacterium sp.]